MAGESPGTGEYQRADFKEVLTNHLHALLSHSFGLLDREPGGYYPNLEKFQAGLDVLQMFTAPYLPKQFYDDFNLIKSEYEKIEQDGIEKIASLDPKQKAHGLEKDLREQIAMAKYNFLLAYARLLAFALAEKNLLLEEEEYSDMI